VASRKNVQSERSFGRRQSQSPTGIAGAPRGRRAQVPQAAGSARRPQWEAVESRVLLSAYTLSELGTFGVNATGANSRSALAADASGNLYGTTSIGGVNGVGTVFEIAAGSAGLTTLAAFNGTNGAQPYGGVTLDAAGNLFGTTDKGGTYNDGTVFEIAKGSNAVTTLVTFNGANGQYPYAGLTPDSSGNLCGTTLEGGPNGGGAIFEIVHGSTTLTPIASVNSSSGGYIEGGVALDASGNLYGTENTGGSSNRGCVFKVARGSNAVTVIASFSQTTGDSPQAGVTIDAAGNLYGTTSSDGPGTPFPGGTVFEIASGSTAITTLAAFGSTNGLIPEAGLTLDASGNVYGTTDSGGASGYGTVFEIASGSNAITTLASFNPNAGTGPQAAVILDGAGNLFGTTFQGGPGGTGTVFEVPAGANAPLVVASFAGTNAVTPWGGLAFDSSGNLFGTANGGGASGDGAVFEIANGSNSLTPLASFNGTNGSYPFDTPAVDAAGNVYGTTQQGGAYGLGTVFEIAHGSNAITTLVSFNYYNGDDPAAGVTLDASGNLYGTTESGGAYGRGTAFEIANGSRAITTLASFDSSNSTNAPTDLTLDDSGNVYGTTYSGGPNGDGTVFEVANGSNQVATLAVFNGTNGEFPKGGVIRDAAGNLYGTTQQGGPNNSGVLFELPAGSNALTTLAAFNVNTIGGYATRLSMDPAGNFYGATSAGGFARGHVFKLPKGSSTFTSLAAFTDTNGAYPEWGVTLDAYGNLYGTTSGGGPGGAGTAFKLAANTTVTLTPAGGPNPSTENQPLTFTATVIYGGASAGPPNGETVMLVDASNRNAPVATATLTSGSATLTVPAGTLSVGTHNLIAEYVGDANYAASESAAYAQTVQAGATAPILVGAPVINGDNPNGLFTAAGQPANGVQRSLVEDIVYTFNEPVVINDPSAAFTVVGTGPHAGTAPSTLLASAVPGTNGTQWAVSLTGKADGVLASIANGEYSISINPNAVFAAADGTTALTSGRTDTFFRLFGDINDDRVVNVSDEFQFSKALNSYTPSFDVNGDGTVNLADEFQASRSFSSGGYVGDGFVTTI
jgi:uncharacterized repeat protein (TIGR03803 family)